jgi:hypothetical protein
VKWDWRPRVARFWNRTVGRLAPRLRVREVANVVIDASKAMDWSAAVTDGSMRVQDWHEAMRAEIRRNYIQQYLAGRGGTGQMTQADWGSVGGSIADQYRYLDRMAREVEAGNLTEGQVRTRVRMYINSSREAYERGQRVAAAEAGLDEVRWVWNPEAEHCEDCEALNGTGWLSTKPWPYKNGGRNMFPGSGDTACLTNCRCHLEYR